jgi:hypothetical protein
MEEFVPQLAMQVGHFRWLLPLSTFELGSDQVVLEDRQALRRRQ